MEKLTDLFQLAQDSLPKEKHKKYFKALKEIGEEGLQKFHSREFQEKLRNLDDFSELTIEEGQLITRILEAQEIIYSHATKNRKSKNHRTNKKRS